MNKSSDERLKDLIAQMTLKHSYWGYLFARIRRVASNELPSIMGVAPTKDGTLQLLYHPEILENTVDDVIKIVIEHEGMHVLNKHVPRLLRIISNEMDEFQKINKSKIWNIAADCAVNCMINMPRTLEINGQPWEGHFPDLYNLPDKKDTEFYYRNLLLQDQKERENGNDFGITGLADGTGCHDFWDKRAESKRDFSRLAHAARGIHRDPGAEVRCRSQRRGLDDRARHRAQRGGNAALSLVCHMSAGGLWVAHFSQQWHRP